MPEEAMPFCEWMRRALFDPEQGYYARQIRTVGRRGDFSTSATVGSGLGEAIASWLRTEQRAQPQVRTVIESGGGSGALMKDVRKALGWWRSRRFRFLMVESSPKLREEQQRTLAGAGAQWFATMNEALQVCAGSAFIYHNELLDAFPVTLLEWSAAEGAWREVWVRRVDGKWTEETRPLVMNEESRAAFQALAWEPATQRQRSELGSAARDWLRDWAPHWQAGAMLTLDYGAEFPEVYHRRPGGSLRGYQHHQLFIGTELYEQMGRRDLTADVNFSDVAAWGHALGWRTEALQTQRVFLQGHLRDFERREKADPALQFQAAAHGAGGEFKALIQRPALARS